MLILGNEFVDLVLFCSASQLVTAADGQHGDKCIWTLLGWYLEDSIPSRS